MTKAKFIAWVDTDSPSPSVGWLERSIEERENGIRQILATKPEFSEHIDLSAVTNSGEVLVEIVTPMKASERGKLLLDVEEYLKEAIDQGLTVWLKAIGDKNSLRRLRGIKIGKI
ncbi:MAG: hypothetical protein K9J78_06815 [Polynucleobacter sp.]|nr:hypothetical protein [Polynucleobacter sp.]